MPSRIDDKTTVPLGIVAVFFATGLSVTATGAFWVSRVNDRLSRIEDKLGIAQSLPPEMIARADAREKREVRRGPASHKR